MCAWSRLDRVGGGLRLRVGGLVRHQCLLPSAQDLFFYFYGAPVAYVHEWIIYSEIICFICILDASPVPAPLSRKPVVFVCSSKTKLFVI
jgi:hypothetical protein